MTLVEIMVSASILTIALSSAIIVIQRGFHNLDIARTSTAASQVMQSEMERIRLLNWGQISALPASANIDIAGTYSSSSIEANRLTITRTIANVSGYGSPSEIKEITLTASWTSIDGQLHTRVFRLRYAKEGLFDYYYNGS